MKKEKRFKIALWVLSLLVVIQGIFIILLLPRPKKFVKPPHIIKGRIAIVIDDWGYSLKNLDTVGQIKYPLTASVLPHLSYSREIARDLHSRGLEIILHLPMEPREKYRLEKNTIMATYGTSEIKNILDDDLSALPGAVGVSNHMGSKATGDLRVMEIVFQELKKKRLYFLDSLVSGQSVCANLAHDTGLAFAKRDVFLDNTEEADYIRQQIQQLKRKARVYGKAIGIGHDRQVTLEVLKEEMPQMVKEGYKFVFVSELTR